MSNRRIVLAVLLGLQCALLAPPALCQADPSSPPPEPPPPVSTVIFGTAARTVVEALPMLRIEAPRPEVRPMTAVGNEALWRIQRSDARILALVEGSRASSPRSGALQTRTVRLDRGVPLDD